MIEMMMVCVQDGGVLRLHARTICFEISDSPLHAGLVTPSSVSGCMANFFCG